MQAPGPGSETYCGLDGSVEETGALVARRAPAVDIQGLSIGSEKRGLVTP